MKVVLFIADTHSSNDYSRKGNCHVKIVIHPSKKSGVGKPAKEIVSAAHRGKFALIIMGTHGHGNLEEAVIGSIACEVIRKGPLPVMVERLPAATTDSEPAFAFDPTADNRSKAAGMQ